MSENTFNAALRTTGFAQRHTEHGFRHGEQLLNEQQWNKDGIELQHVVHAARQSTSELQQWDHLMLRRQRMQLWADFLDELRLETL